MVSKALITRMISTLRAEEVTSPPAGRTLALEKELVGAGHQSSQAKVAPPTRLGPVSERTNESLQVNRHLALELAVTHEMARILASTRQLDEALSRIMARIERTLQVEAGALLLTEPATGELAFQVVLSGIKQTKGMELFRLPEGKDVIRYVAQTGKPLLLARVEPGQRRFIKLSSLLQVEPRNLLCIPLTVYREVIGVLAVLNKSAGPFTPHDLAFLKTMAPYLAVVVENARLRESVLAERDRVLEVEEQVRHKVAGDLHDGPLQLVSGMVMNLDYCRNILEKDPAQARAEIAKIQELGLRGAHQMRTLLVELRPLELEQHGQGLAAALRVFLERRQKEVKTTKLILEIKTAPLKNQISRQEAQAERAIFIIVQETVNNALKHAQARHILVRLVETPTTIKAVIADDGKGFEMMAVMCGYAQQGSLGIFNIRERAEAIGGELVIKSVPGRGTHITLKVPKAREERRRRRGTTGPLTLPPGMLPPA